MQFFKEIKKTALANSIVQLGLKKLSSDNKKQESSEKQIQNKEQHEVIQEEEEQPNEQTVLEFVQNIVSTQRNKQKERKMKKNKARAKVFEDLQIQPIYIESASITKIFSMEFDNPLEQLIQRIQILVEERQNVDMILAKILFSGYLWEACNMDHKDFILESYEVVEIYIQKLSSLQKKIKNQRSEISLCLNRVNKISKILKERVLIKKKLRALKNLKSYKKDLFLKTKNVDEIFYVDRNRQKNYIKLINNMNFIERIQCMKKDREKMIIQCSQNMLIVQKIIQKWIDHEENLEPKYIQKIFILIYFSKTHPMYTDSKITIDWKKIKNLKLLSKKILEVKEWKDYKYVNDFNKKDSVKQFLGSCYDEIQKIRKSKKI